MVTTMPPPQHELREVVLAEQFDPVEFVHQQAGYSRQQPFSGLHFDTGIKGSLSLRLFCALYMLYTWLTALMRRR